MYADSLTLTGKGEKDYLDVMSIANRLALSTLESGGEVQKERENNEDEKDHFSMFDSINQNTQKNKDLCYRKQAFYHRDNYFPVFQPTFFF